MTDVVVMVLWQMLLPYVCLLYGRCYCHVVFGRCCKFYVEDVNGDQWCYYGHRLGRMPTSRYKNKLMNILKTIKTKRGISEALYRKLYPTGAGSPKFYGIPKIHKKEIPLRPIVSSNRSSQLCNIKRAGQDLEAPGW